MKKEVKIVIVHTNDRTSLLLRPNGKLEYFENPQILSACSTSKYLHLYVVSDDEIKEGDWVLTTSKYTEHKIQQVELIRIGWEKRREIVTYNTVHYYEEYKKVIASTDKRLNLAGLKDNFLYQFSQSTLSRKWEVQKDKNGNYQISDNKMWVLPILEEPEKKYTKEDLKKAWCDGAESVLKLNQSERFEKWFKNNF